MKTLFLALSLFGLSVAVAQNTDTKKVYTTSTGEWIFSFGDIEVNGESESPVVRFSPFFNQQFVVHYDPTNFLGVFAGASIRNVGFIYDQSETIRKKFRTYNFGIPVGLKLGVMDKGFAYGGYEIEFPFNYKEKTFEDNTKEKFNEWFSNRVPSYYNTFFVGVQFPKGLNVKFKYYLTEFFNRGFTETVTVNGIEQQVMPYAGLNVNNFYVSISFQLFGKGDTGIMKDPGKGDITSMLY